MITDQFEILLLAAVVKHSGVYDKTVGLVDSSAFSSILSAEVFELLKSFHTEYKRPPSQQELLHLYKRDRIVDDDSNIVNYLNAIYNQEVDAGFVIKELRSYVYSRKLEKLMKTNYESIKLGKGVNISDVVSEIFRIQMSAATDKRIYGLEIHKSEAILEEGESGVVVPTNIKYLNEILNGGLRGGQLGIILAPPNYGKTMMLLQFALYAWMKKKNVLFVTLEMKEFSILRRAMMLLSGALKVKVDNNLLSMITERQGARFVICYRPVKSMQVDHLYSIYHQAEADGIKFDAIYIDYADLLASPRKYKEKRFELSDIFDSLKSFGQMQDVPVWSATQANREGMRANTITMAHMSEDISKAFISDIIISLNDKMQSNSTIKLYLTKHREGKSDLYIDTFVNEHMWFEETTNIQPDLGRL